MVRIFLHSDFRGVLRIFSSIYDGIFFLQNNLHKNSIIDVWQGSIYAVELHWNKQEEKKLYYIFPEMGLVILSKEDGKIRKQKLLNNLPRCLLEKSRSENFTKFDGTQVSLCGYGDIFQNCFFIEHLWRLVLKNSRSNDNCRVVIQIQKRYCQLTLMIKRSKHMKK